MRVAATGETNNYVQMMFKPLKDRIELVQWPVETWLWIDEFRAHLHDVDLINLHWPENRFGLNPDNHRAAIEAVREAGVPVVWWAHDAVPHNYEKGDRSVIYQLWAEAASAVVHSSNYGREQMMGLYRFNPEAIHRVIHHPHWGKRLSDFDGTREAAEHRFGLPPVPIRIGVHASPRPAKDVQLAMDAFAACSRQDMQLFVTCLSGETVPDDPRIFATPYTFLRGDDFKLMVRAIDVFLLPFRAGYSTLSTGTVMDAVALCKPMLVSDWPYFAEVVGEAGICYGNSREDLTACLNRLDTAALQTATEASTSLNKRTKFRHAAAELMSLLDEVRARC